MTTDLDLVDNDLLTLAATLRATFAMLKDHPNYGLEGDENGTMLCNVGLILCDVATRLDHVGEKFDGQELAQECAA